MIGRLFTGHGEISVANLWCTGRLQPISYRSGNHVGRPL